MTKAPVSDDFIATSHLFFSSLQTFFMAPGAKAGTRTELSLTNVTYDRVSDVCV